MIKKQYTKETILEATCDICGADCLIPLHIAKPNENITKEFEGMELNAVWGYGSSKDGEVWKGCVCEKCVDKHLKPLVQFSIKPY